MASELKKFKVQTTLFLDYKKRNNHKISYSSAKLIASDSDIDESFKSMHHSITTKIKNYGSQSTHSHDMIRTCSQMHCTDRFTQYSSIMWPVWLNGWVLLYELSGCVFDSRWSYLNLRYCACFEQGVPWHSGKECRFTLKCVRDAIRRYSLMGFFLLLFSLENVVWNVCDS